MRHRLLLLILTSACLTILARGAKAQDQENKLIDRIMRPDMSLANSAQDKKFVAVEGTSVDRKFEAKSFVTAEEQKPKAFAGVRNFFARHFGTKKFSRTKAAAAKTAADADARFATEESSLIRTSNDEGKKAAVRDYAENKPFHGKGTRQEILSQQDRPMTIDEIRELLNKNE